VFATEVVVRVDAHGGFEVVMGFLDGASVVRGERT
jgi:hypothetical protein